MLGYDRPYLLADSIDLEADRHLTLRRGSRTLRLDVVEEAGSALDFFRSAQDPESEIWSETGDEGANALLDLLDRSGWIVEDMPSGSDALYRGLADELHDRVSRITAEHLSGDASMVRAMERLGVMPSDGAHAPANFHASVAAKMIAAWQATQPGTARLFDALVRGAAKAELAHIVRDLAGLSEIAGMRRQIVTVLSFVESGLSQPARRRNYGDYIPEPVRARATGGPSRIAPSRCLVAAEDAVMELLDEISGAVVMDALRDADRPRDVARQVFVNQHYVTIHYIRAICSALSANLSHPLRAVLTRYLREEVGHEEHEREACRDLGMSDAEIDAAEIGRHFVAYISILIAEARRDPLVFCLAVTIAEGLPGTRKGLVDAIRESGVEGEHLDDHQSIDDRLDHTRFTRLIFGAMEDMDTRRAVDAMERFLFLAEISQRAWVELSEMPHD